jgi:hypothetical protein
LNASINNPSTTLLNSFLSFIFLDTSFSTDYDAYLKRIQNPLWFLANTRDYFFDSINFLLHKTAISNTLHIKIVFTLNYLFFSLYSLEQSMQLLL